MAPVACPEGTPTVPSRSADGAACVEAEAEAEVGAERSAIVGSRQCTHRIKACTVGSFDGPKIHQPPPNRSTRYAGRMSGVSVTSLVKKFGTTVAVAGVDITMESGKLFFLLGPSGCGKTTLLRMIAGFETPTSGHIHFGDKDVSRLPAEKRDAGMVFQGYALWPHLSVFENVAFGLRVRKTPTTEIQTRVGEALELVKMTGLGDRKPTQLSGGQQQRVALARALAFRPSVLLLDEPLSNLDAKLRLEMRSEIRRIVDEASITTIYVTHDQEEALSLADAMAVLKDGKVIQAGAPRDLYDRPSNRFTASFLGDTNFLDGTVVENTGSEVVVDTAIGRLRSRGSRPDGVAGAVTVSLRPEAIRLTDASEDGNRVTMSVSGTMFLGQTAEITLTSGEATLRALELHPREVRAAGDSIEVQFAPEDVVLLPA